MTHTPKEAKHVAWGFTLIEILVVTTVIMIFSGMSLAYYNKLTADRDLQRSTEAVVNVLELAKKRAQAADLFATCTTYTGYRLLYVSTTSYRLQFCCEVACGTPSDVQTYTLESGNTFTSNFSNVRFVPLTGASSAASPSTIIISNSSSCRRICISTSGAISQDKVTCTSPPPCS